MNAIEQLSYEVHNVLDLIILISTLFRIIEETMNEKDKPVSFSYNRYTNEFKVKGTHKQLETWMDILEDEQGKFTRIEDND